MSKVTFPAVVEAYIATRNEIAKRKKEFEQEINELKEIQVKREKWMQAQLDKNNVDSMKSDAGTVFKKVDTAFRVQDWQAFKDWAIANGHESMFKRDVQKTEVVAFMDESKELPPGLAMEKMLKINVRVSNTRKGDNDE